MKKTNLIFDFDGIFAADMLYDQNGKSAKSFPWGIRHSLEILKENGFDIYIITGDSTKFGQNITRKFCNNLPISDIFFISGKNKLNFLKKKFDLDTVIYSGDDIFDIELFKEVYAICHKDTHYTIQRQSNYISSYTPRDYYFMDMMYHILQVFKYDSLDVDEIFIKHSTHEPMSEYLQDKRFKRILIFQQFSMRNHSDGTYNVLLDGNLNLTLHRLYEPIKNNPKLIVTITCPINHNKDQMVMLKTLIDELFDGRIIFDLIEYGENALENRSKFENIDVIELAYDLLISDFSKISQYKNLKTIFNFNISKVNELDRPYIDDFYDNQFDCIDAHSLIYVLNENQKEQFLSDASNTYEEQFLNGRIVVDSKVMNKELLKFQMNYFLSYIDSKSFNNINETLSSIINGCPTFFIPFRLTDSCYKFNTILNTLSEQKEKSVILVTNPNDTDLSQYQFSNIDIIDISKTFNMINKKSLYFYMLNILKKFQIMIPIFEDPSIVLHQSLIEMNTLCPSQCIFFSEKENSDFEDYFKSQPSKYLDNQIYDEK